MTSGFVARDQRFNNLAVQQAGRSTASEGFFSAFHLSGGQLRDVMVNDGHDRGIWSPQLAQTSNTVQGHSTDIQSQVKLNAAMANHVSALTNYVASGTPVPTPAPGRTVTFSNLTSVALDLYVTEGYPTPTPPTLLATLAATTGTYVWNIPEILGWSGNFQVAQSGTQPLPGATLAEFGFNQLWPGLGCLRDDLDLSTVPPGLGTQLVNGPHSACQQLSFSMGYSLQQSRGYNVGMQIVPPTLPPQPCTPTTLPTQTVTCVSIDGDSPDSIGFPNDTAFPKQQTGYAQGNYSVNFLNPVAF
jgi:hypothetical protein